MKSKTTQKKKEPSATPAMVREVLGKERITALSNQAACEVNGGIAQVLQGACAMAAGMYSGNVEAQAAQAAIFTIQGCGSRPVKDDVQKVLDAVKAGKSK